jgi:hypothetical protein
VPREVTVHCRLAYELGLKNDALRKDSVALLSRYLQFLTFQAHQLHPFAAAND